MLALDAGPNLNKNIPRPSVLGAPIFGATIGNIEGIVPSKGFSVFSLITPLIPVGFLSILSYGLYLP